MKHEKTEKNPKGSGRPKLGNVLYQRRINPVLIEVMDKFLNECKKK